ncbi:MAG TPA: class I SAM-dependent methyltransferase [Thermoanaerobaculia bacterium]|jgi:ubiquinone/menaquinone biosynthesis C-methylase UbiE
MGVNTNRWNRARYTLYAPFYDPIVRRLGRGRRRAIELLDVKPGERVLIDGCGTGLDLELLPRDCVVTAIDLTPAMVEKTRARAAALGMSIDARVMDAARLEFAGETFDCVLLHLILAVVPDPHTSAREAARVLRRGGRASVFDKFAAGRPSLLRRVFNVITNFVATDITRSLAEILGGTELRVVREEASVFGGVFRAALLVKT